MNTHTESPTILALRDLDSCAVANAIEALDPTRLRNVGYGHGNLRWLFPTLGPLVGHAVTAKVRTSAPPMGGRYVDRTDWWEDILRIPAPRIVVIQDVDPVEGGRGAFIGGVHAHILRAFGCVGVITDGAVRDVDQVGQLGFPLLAKKLAVSHAYAHLVEFSGPVEVDGLAVAPGDLIHADRHGAIRVPRDLAAAVPARAEQLRQHERLIIAECRSPGFSPARLKKLLETSPAHAGLEPR